MNGVTMHAKQVFGFIAMFVCVAAGMLIPGSDMLGHEGVLALAILAGAIFMWFCGSMSTGMTGVLACFLLLILGVVPTFGDAFSGFITTTTWFVLGVFCMTLLMQKSTLGLRLTKRFIVLAKGDSKRLVLMLMAAAAVISSFMTDTGAVALMMSFALPLLDTLGAKKGSSNLGRCLLLGVSFGALFGGFTTPIGHSLNVLAAGLYTQATGLQINFLSWMSYGIPICVAILPIAWFALIKAFPPEHITEDAVQEVLGSKFETGPMNALDKKCLALLIILPTLWILGNWIPLFNATTVALAGMLLLFFPGISIVTWSEFERATSWNLFMFFGGVLSIGAAIASTGAADFIATLFLQSGITEMPVFAALLAIAAFLYLLHTFCPISPSWVAIFLPPMMTYATVVGIPPFLPAFLIVCLIAGSYLVPLCPALNMTFDTGWYKFSDTAKAGWFTSIAFVVIAVAWSYAMGGILGIH